MAPIPPLLQTPLKYRAHIGRQRMGGFVLSRHNRHALPVHRTCSTHIWAVVMNELFDTSVSHENVVILGFEFLNRVKLECNLI